MKIKNSTFLNSFPNTLASGYYDPFPQIITISQYDENEFKTHSINHPNETDIKKISLLIHELTHWFDHISTIWGQKNLILIYNALNARKGNNPSEFWRIKELSNNMAGHKFYDYFFEDFGNNESQKNIPWTHQVTTGLRFSESGKLNPNKPIMFSRFSSYDGTQLLRAPISTASILETNAVYSEFSTRNDLIKNIKDEKTKESITNMTQTELASMLYNKDYVLYTMGPHLAAILGNESDPFKTYTFASTFGTIALNIPTYSYGEMKISNAHSSTNLARLKKLKKNQDIGFCFYNLLNNYFSRNGSGKIDLENVLFSSNLPAPDAVNKLIIKEMNDNKKLIIDGPFKKMAISIIDLGISLFKTRGIDGKKTSILDIHQSRQFTPKIIYGDTFFEEKDYPITKILENLEKTFELTLPETYFLFQYYNQKFIEYINVCGI